MRFPKDGKFTTVKVERLTGGNLDNSTGNWQDAESLLVAEAEIDIQPKTGSETDSFRDSSYNKTLIGFIGIDDITFSSGFTKILQGDLIDQKYKVINVKDWLTHYELELEQI